MSSRKGLKLESSAPEGAGHEYTAEQRRAVSTLQRKFREIKAARAARDAVQEHYSVKTVAPGIIHTRVRGTSEHFARIGIDVAARNIEHGANKDSEHVRTMDILSIDRNQYRGGVAGGERLAPAHETAKDVAEDTGQPTAFINASYFNYGDARQKDRPDFTPIGPTVSGGKALDSLPVPKPYRRDYTSLTFTDTGDVVTAGPRLAGPKSGFLGLGSKPLAQSYTASSKSKYNYRNRKGETYPTSAIPGYFHHAGDPNARAAISWPKVGGGPPTSTLPASQDRIRMMTITPNTGRTAGFTMAELSAAATRVTSWNRTAGGALNLDGGGSASMGVVRADKTLAVSAGYNDPGGDYSARPLSTIITYGKK